ncbi:MAG: TIGR03792 family protein [Paracoccaceae bacterium]
MVIEWLRFTVPVVDQARYLAADAEIWTVALAGNPGFLGKEVWVRNDDPTSVNLIIKWASREEWKAVPAGLLAKTDAAFQAAMGAVFPVLDCIDYEVM